MPRRREERLREKSYVYGDSPYRAAFKKGLECGWLSFVYREQRMGLEGTVGMSQGRENNVSLPV